jgi:hypothetical protein
MRPHVGDRITVESERVSQPGRTGVIEEIVGEDPPRMRVRWDDGHESVFTPAAGAAKVTSPERPMRA